ncbi:MAG: S8 family peptidase [Lysobacter sp.]|nr:MAG: S8 family peptidase [Lysobacter sp.]
MKNRISKLSFAIFATLACASAPLISSAADFRTNGRPIEGQYIVVLKPQAASLASEIRPTARVSTVARGIAANHGAKLVRSFEQALRGFVVQADDAALAKLLADPRVDYVEEDGIVTANPAYQQPPSWGVDRVDQRDLPLDGWYAFFPIGIGVHAYVVDTGVRPTHTQFNWWTGAPPSRVSSVGYTAIADGNGTNDCHGHGTHVAGTMAGGSAGIAKGATIHPVRVLGCTGSGTWSGVIAGMDWVRLNHTKPAVANMSLGGLANSSVDAAVANLTAAGVVVVVAAGNNYGDSACNYSPARAPSAITVGSTDINDARSDYSNIGSCIDIFAPGRNIVSASNLDNTSLRTLSGTSMASPHVAGFAALIMGQLPNASVAEVTQRLLTNATPNKVINPGAGSLNRLLYVIPNGGVYGTYP